MNRKAIAITFGGLVLAVVLGVLSTARSYVSQPLPIAAVDAQAFTACMNYYHDARSCYQDTIASWQQPHSGWVVGWCQPEGPQDWALSVGHDSRDGWFFNEC